MPILMFKERSNTLFFSSAYRWRIPIQAAFSSSFVKPRNRPLCASARLGMAGTEVVFATESLCQSVGVTGYCGVPARGGVCRLGLARPKLDDGDAWDYSHVILKQDAGDKSDNYWFCNAGHGQFDAALTASSVGAGVRIAHLDTGYAPDHKSVPKNLRRDLARNLVDADRPNDATDLSEDAAFNNFCHGCGKLSILAGPTVPRLKPFGCAPVTEIVPVRVANRVPLFSNSSIARAFDYVHRLYASDPNARSCRKREHGRPPLRPQAGSGWRISRGRRARRSHEQRLLRASRSQPSELGGRERSRAVGVQSAVPPAGGLRGRGRARCDAKQLMLVRARSRSAGQEDARIVAIFCRRDMLSTTKL
jgi:hypothetical protein